MTELIHNPTNVVKKSLKGKRNRRNYESGLYSGHLYPEANFWYGVASVFDLFGLLDDYNYSRSSEEADARGLQSDYYAVANDFWGAVRQFEGEHSSEKLPEQYRLFDPDKI